MHELEKTRQEAQEYQESSTKIYYFSPKTIEKVADIVASPVAVIATDGFGIEKTMSPLRIKE